MTEEYRDIQRRLMQLESMIIDIYDNTVQDKKTCPICKNKIRLYLPFGVKYRSNAICPVCRSLERHRALWLYFEKNSWLFDSSNRLIRVLHFAPEGVFYNKFSQIENVDYYPVDFNPKFPGIRKQVDITDIPFEDNYFDIIICNHVLEHIPDEKKSLSELHRVLNASGVAFLSVPIDDKRDITLENKDYNTPELREQYYGQSDHVRLYGKDYMEHLQDGGFMVDEINPYKEYSTEELKKFGLISNEKIYQCTKKH